jgi:hypothetical protein
MLELSFSQGNILMQYFDWNPPINPKIQGLIFFLFHKWDEWKKL